MLVLSKYKLQQLVCTAVGAFMSICLWLQSSSTDEDVDTTEPKSADTEQVEFCAHVLLLRWGKQLWWLHGLSHQSEILKWHPPILLLCHFLLLNSNCINQLISLHPYRSADPNIIFHTFLFLLINWVKRGVRRVMTRTIGTFLLPETWWPHIWGKFQHSGANQTILLI